MIEHPILFNDEMVRAILDGRKTQTRRPLKPQPDREIWDRVLYEQHHPDIPLFHMKNGDLLHCGATSPFGRPGDLLWVRECWHPTGRPGTALYRADNECEVAAWRPSIHMPRWASRITLKAVAVRVEQIQAISARDVEAEGVDVAAKLPIMPCKNPEGLAETIARHAFQPLWDSIYAKKGLGWDVNPWVWCCEFKVIND